MSIHQRLAVLLDEHPRADPSVLATRLLDSVETVEELRALVYPQVRKAFEQERRRRAERKAHLRAREKARANVKPCLWYRDPTNPAVIIVAPEDRATPAERLAAAELDRWLAIPGNHLPGFGEADRET